MGRRSCHPNPARPMACARTRARSAEDEARSAANAVSQSMSVFLVLPTSYLTMDGWMDGWMDGGISCKHANTIRRRSQLLVPRPQRGRFAPQPQYAASGPGWGGEGYPMQAYPPPGMKHTSYLSSVD